MKTKVAVKSGIQGFRDFISFLRLRGSDIVRMEHDGEYEILTVIQGQRDNADFINTLVLRSAN